MNLTDILAQAGGLQSVARDLVALPLIDVVHNHSITRSSLPGPRASFLRTSLG